MAIGGRHKREPRECDVCRRPFVPYQAGQKVCSIRCAGELARRREENKARIAAKRAAQARRAEIREGRERLKSTSELEHEAQRAFNAYVRLRDELANLPCPSCGEFAPPTFHGGAWDCGHFRTVGACPELRFEPLNAWRQCKSCNSGVRRKGSRVVVAHDPERAMTIRARYRAELERRIGPEKLAWLEGPHEPKRYRADDYRAEKAKWLAAARELRTKQKVSRAY